MEPVTIALGAGAAFLLYKGLKGSAPSPAQSATIQGESTVAQVGAAGANIAAGEQAGYQGIEGKEFKGLVGAGGAGVTAGTAAAAAGGAGSGLVAGAVTFGVGAVVGLAAVLWAKHEARIKGAKTENAAVNLIAPAWKESLLGIMAAYNAGQISDVVAVNELESLRSLTYAALQKYNHTPGVDWAGGGSQPGLGPNKLQYWSVTCDKHCTIGCCLFNGAMGPGISNVEALIKHKIAGPTITIPAMAPKPAYGFRGLDKFTVTVTK